VLTCERILRSCILQFLTNHLSRAPFFDRKPYRFQSPATTINKYTKSATRVAHKSHTSPSHLFFDSLRTQTMTSSDVPEKKKIKSLKEKYPEIYKQTNIDRRGCERVVPMEILSLGMGRTGTMCEFLTFHFLIVFLCISGNYGGGGETE
jgi:hypothetical protein